jgi:hypothetical protein
VAPKKQKDLDRKMEIKKTSKRRLHRGNSKGYRKRSFWINGRLVDQKEISAEIGGIRLKETGGKILNLF